MGASMRYQTRALFAKSAVYQRRNTATNICLVVAPIFFCVLLAVLQLLANNLLLNQRSNKCGCQCTECCIPRREQIPWTEEQQARIDAGEQLRPRFRRYDDCQPLTTGYCERWRNSTCRSYNDSNCSLRFSSPQQAIFCPIPTPSSWPPVIMTPRRAFRAGGPSTQWLPYTGRNMTAATAVAANFFQAPELPNPQALLDLLNQSPLALLSLRPEKILQLLLPVLSPGGLVLDDGEAVDLAQLSRLGLNFGSGLWPNNDYYLENAFINSNSNNSQLNFLVPTGVCNATGLYRLTTSANNQMPLAAMLLSYYNATYPAVLGPVLRLLNVTADTILARVGDSALSTITAACVDTLAREANTTAQLDRRLYCGFGLARCDGTLFWREYGGAWDFESLSPTELVYTAHYNLSLPADNGPENYRLPGLLDMATRAWTQTYWGNVPIVNRVRNRLMGVMSFPKAPTDLKLDFSVLLGPLFYTWVIQMLMPSLLQQLVYEKEKRLRMMMKMHGLGDGAYWFVTYIWYLMLYCVYMVFFVVFGSAIRLKMFTSNSYSVQAVLYFIFGNNMIAFMFVLSSLFHSSRTATVVAFLYIFASGLIGELLLRQLMHEHPEWIIAVELIPGFALYRGLYEMSEYSIRALFANVPGLTWSDLSDPNNGMIGAWIILAAEWPFFMLLGWYLEQVLSNGTGMRRHPLFFIRWMWHKPNTDLAATLKEHPNLALAGAGSGSLGAGANGQHVPDGKAVSSKGEDRETCLLPPAGGEIEMKRGAVGSGKAAVAEGLSRSGSADPAAVGAAGTAASPRGSEAAAGAAAGADGSRPVSAGSGAGEGARGASRCASGNGSGGGGGHGVADDAVSLPGSIPDTNADHNLGAAGGVGAAGGAAGGVALVTATTAAGATSSSGDASPHSAAVASPLSAGSGIASTSSGASSSQQPALAAATATATSQAAASAAVTSAASSSTASGDARIIVQPGAAAPAGLKLGATAAPASPGGGISGAGGEAAPAAIVIDAKDVAAEADRVIAMSTERLADTPIVVRGLSKVFATERGASGAARTGGGCLAACFGVTRGRAAVRSLTLAIERGECFGLLGPNGAGKTTTINMLTGFLEPTGGDALVEGRSVRTRMPEIYRMMGVCPQENLLWEQLTGEEHLLFYGRLKGLAGAELTEAVAASLRAVKLHVNNAGKRRVAAYSGGMKRRLSVAISFIGAPKVVYLDEPSTGLDPASRRSLWDVVRAHKAGRGIILTTHSMEEAEILCDRLGIFVDGQLVCIGNPREITSRYAGYFVFTLTVAPGFEEAAQAFVRRLSPAARLTYALGGTFKYELPHADVSLAGVFGAMAAAKSEMQVLDWGVANATLEEVFIKFARAIGAETSEGH